MNVDQTAPIAKALSLAKATARTLKMLRHTSAGWEVLSEDGSKHLGGPYPSKDAAVARLAEVEGHKTQKVDGSRGYIDIVVRVPNKDAANAVRKLIENVNKLGAPGHSFGIVSDDKPPTTLGGWDGDGSMRAEVVDMQEHAAPAVKKKDHTLELSDGWHAYSQVDGAHLSGPHDSHATALESVASEKVEKDAGTTLGSGDLANGGALVADQTVPVSLLRRFNGVPVRVDRPKGFVQNGVGEDGVAWERTYKNDYGEIPGTAGGDGDALDVFLGDDETAKDAHWVIQRKSDGAFDEYKVVLGAPDEDAAKAIYLAHTPEKFFSGMAKTSVEMIKALLGLEPVETMKAIAKAHAMDVIAKALDDAESQFAKLIINAVAETQKSDAEPSMPVRLLPIAKADEGAPEQRFILGVVLEPETVDAQGDIYSAAEIEQTAHRFLAEYRNTDLQHKVLINPLVKIVESSIARADHEINGQPVKAGTWLLAHVVLDDELWAAIKRGEFTGYSIKGFSNKEPAVAA